MARTRSKQFPDNQNLILDKAAELFARLGFHRASIADLARECNYSKASLYHYYASKEDILFEVLDQHMDELTELADQSLIPSVEPVTRFRNFVHDAMCLYVRKVNQHTVLNRDMRYLPEPLRDKIRFKERALLMRITELLLLIKPELSAQPGSEKVYAMMFFGMLNWTYTWFHADGTTSAEQFADMAGDLYLNGLNNLNPAMFPAAKGLVKSAP